MSDNHDAKEYLNNLQRTIMIFCYFCNPYQSAGNPYPFLDDF